MNEIFQPEGTITFDSLCALCRQPLRLYVPEDSRCETTKAAIDAMVRMTAHEECVADRRNLERESRKAETILARQEVWEMMCAPEFRKELDFSNSNCRKAVWDQVSKWKYNARGIYLQGKGGMCKTRMMFKLLEREHDAGRKIVAVTHPQFRLEVSALASEDQRGLQRYLQNLCLVDILYIDDLGKGTFTNASEEALAHVIDTRSKWQNPMMFTANDDYNTLKERLSADRGSPMLRRIIEFCENIRA